jgi:hypothetical protein
MKIFRSFKVIISTIVISVIFFSCGNNRSEPNGKERTPAFSLEKDFKFRALTETLDSQKDSRAFESLSNIPDSLVHKWVESFQRVGNYGNKLVSYQYGNDRYHTILISVVDGVHIDNNKTDSTDDSYADQVQYLLTVKENGDVIGGLNVYMALSLDDLEETIIG